MEGAASTTGPSFVSTQHQIFRPTRNIQAQASSADARRARHHPTPCLPICPGLQRLGSCSSGSLSPASSVDAGMPSTHGSCGTRDRQRFPKFTSMRRLHSYRHSNPCQRSRAYSHNTPSLLGMRPLPPLGFRSTSRLSWIRAWRGPTR